MKCELLAEQKSDALINPFVRLMLNGKTEFSGISIHRPSMGIIT